MAKQGERLAATIFGISFVAAMLVLALAVPHPSQFQQFIFRVVLALAAAGVAVTIPGAINVEVGTGIRASGAIAVFALLYLVNPAQLVTDSDAGPSRQGGPPALIKISYQLLGKMQEGRAVVYISNREVGTLRVDETHPTSSIELTLPRPGTYEYSVQARMAILGVIDLESGFEMPFEQESSGRGTIEVEPGKEFVLTTNNLRLSPTGNTWYATLSDKATER